MTSQPNWRSFYEELRGCGLDVLDGVDEHLEYFVSERLDGDAFDSESLEAVLKALWLDDPEWAVRVVIADYAKNVRDAMAAAFGGAGKNVFAFTSEDADDVPEPREMIAGIRPRFEPTVIARLLKAAEADDSDLEPNP